MKIISQSLKSSLEKSVRNVILLVGFVTVYCSTISAQCNSSSCTGTSTFFGVDAGMSNTGPFNSFFGNSAGKNNSTARSNSFFGTDCGLNTTTGAGNSFYGHETGLNNTTGVLNSFFGEEAGKNNSTGYHNCFFGENTGLGNTTGINNCFFGQLSGELNTTGNGNSLFGHNAGRYIVTGDYNICIGRNSGPVAGTDPSRKLYIDDQTTDDPLILGDFQTNLVKINGNFEVTGEMGVACVVSPSDSRLKKNITPLTSVLSIIAALEPSSYQFKDEMVQAHGLPSDQQYGFLTQDVEKVLPSLISQKALTGLDGTEYQGLEYTALIPILTQAIKELNEENDSLKERLNRIEASLNK